MACWTRIGLCACALLTVATATEAKRVASINMCTDQLLLDLAAPETIVGLSPYSRDAARSWLAIRARNFPLLSGTAEEILVLKPDLVLSGGFTRRETRDFIRAAGIVLEEFDIVHTIAEAKQQIVRAGALVSADQRASERSAAIDAAVARVRAAAADRPIRILPVSRRGWVSGGASLMSDLLSVAGLTNAAAELGFDSGGFVSLETIVKLKPDALLLARDDDRAEDQGQAMLMHPAIAALFPLERRIVMPERLTVCGGPMLAEALDALAAQIARLKPRNAR